MVVMMVVMIVVMIIVVVMVVVMMMVVMVVREGTSKISLRNCGGGLFRQSNR